MSSLEIDLNQVLQRARSAIKKGDRQAARRLAQWVLKRAPKCEEAWLILAAIANPKASIYYLRKALQINPGSLRAKKGMQWAIQRLAQEEASRQNLLPRTFSYPSTRARSYPRKNVFFYILFASFILLGGMGSLILFGGLMALQAQVPFRMTGSFFDSLISTPTTTWTSTPTDTPTSTFTSSPTFTPTSTSTFTPTATFTLSPLPTFTDTPSPTPIPSPTKKKKHGPAPRPEVVGASERWIDVDLSSQQLYALEGDVVLQTFLVSTGTWQHPTVTGLFRIYVKYRSAHMSGPGYFLPNVPYVMYFYKDYGLHGTYWHNNFGTPMSHGCVNLRIEDAKWLYNWASIGTVVNIHP